MVHMVLLGSSLTNSTHITAFHFSVFAVQVASTMKPKSPRSAFDEHVTAAALLLNEYVVAAALAETDEATREATGPPTPEANSQSGRAHRWAKN